MNKVERIERLEKEIASAKARYILLRKKLVNELRQVGTERDVLMGVLAYHAATGTFRWKRCPANRGRDGKVAGSEIAGGYIRISVYGREHYAHRLAWLFVHGEWPKGLIDHRNGIRGDNRIANLRDATNSQNNANKAPRAVSGIKGVQRNGNRWAARCGDEYLGLYDTKQEAGAAYAARAAERFGEFARIER